MIRQTDGTCDSQSCRQLEVRVQLNGQPTLGEVWQTDGPGRWWNDAATITIDGGQAVWRYSTRADQL